MLLGCLRCQLIHRNLTVNIIYFLRCAFTKADFDVKSRYAVVQHYTLIAVSFLTFPIQTFYSGLFPTK